MTTNVRRISIFADGGCSGNPGPGGYGIILKDELTGTVKTVWGKAESTTNNKMELTAAIVALKRLKLRSDAQYEITLVTDSEYVQKGLTEWVPNWKRNNWRTAKKQPVKNADLWQELVALVEKYQVSVEWTKGHAGHAENELADQLAQRAIRYTPKPGEEPYPALGWEAMLAPALA